MGCGDGFSRNFLDHVAGLAVHQLVAFRVNRALADMVPIGDPGDQNGW
jgi:hypothetical protein